MRLVARRTWSSVQGQEAVSRACPHRPSGSRDPLGLLAARWAEQAVASLGKDEIAEFWNNLSDSFRSLSKMEKPSRKDKGDAPKPSDALTTRQLAGPKAGDSPAFFFRRCAWAFFRPSKAKANQLVGEFRGWLSSSLEDNAYSILNHLMTLRVLILDGSVRAIARSREPTLPPNQEESNETMIVELRGD